ncbi:conserved protein, unknown function [Hepatocystis sp. ex Piliocolobus tephrosceles]|nr:conserved protein, unknown function [Hepatocystis sp. ex Piliocolobus tephrosceles]
MIKYIIFSCLILLLNKVACNSKISKCLFYDKRNEQLKQTFYIPTSDVSMYKITIKKLLTREINLLDDTAADITVDENDKANGNNKISNFDDIKKKNEKKKKEEMEKKLKYIENYRNYVRNVLKNVEFKCESITNSASDVKCNLCVYTEIINNKHIRQGQILQIFMNECMYGFYYFDNLPQYTENNKLIQNMSEDDQQSKLDDVYYNITKDVISGNTKNIQFFKKQSSVYHPVCYVTD